nr:hypothetical protein [Acidithiobacillus caldus]
MKASALLAVSAALLSGCSAIGGNDSAYRAAMQTYLESVMKSDNGSPQTAFCLSVYSGGTGTDYSSDCNSEVAKGYSFATPVSQLKNQNLIALESAGLIHIGKQFDCVVKGIGFFGPAPVYHYPVIPVKMNKGATYVDNFGGQKICFGGVKVAHVLSATKPHFNSKYSMKTSVVRFSVGYSGISMDLVKKSPDLKKKILGDRHESVREAMRKSEIVTAVLGKESSNHWKVLKLVSAKPA